MSPQYPSRRREQAQRPTQSKLADRAALGHGPDSQRAFMKDEYEGRAKRLGDELERLVKLVSWARECLENEFQSGLGYKQMTLAKGDLTKLKDLASTMNSAVDAKIRFDKASKQLAESMTPEEEFESVMTYLRSLSLDKMRDAIQRLQYHSEKMAGH